MSICKEVNDHIRFFIPILAVKTSQKSLNIKNISSTHYGPDKLNLLPLYHLTFKFDLDLQPTSTNVSNYTSTPRGQQLYYFEIHA